MKIHNFMPGPSKSHWRASLLLLLLLPVVILLSGCSASQLWTNKFRFYPARNLNLQLSWSPEIGDVLVRYDETCPGLFHKRTRSYWLFAYTAEAAKKEIPVKPNFVTTTGNLSLIKIPILTNDPVPVDLATHKCLAVAVTNQIVFKLWLDNTNRGAYILPTYDAPIETWKSLGLTAPVAAMDTFGMMLGGGVTEIQDRQPQVKD